MKVLIAVPTKNRADRICDYTLSWLPEIDVDWQIFVEPQDVNKYAKVVDKKHIVDIGDNNRGLGYSKVKIKEYAIRNNYDLIFKVDDDLMGWWGTSRRKADSITFDVFNQLMVDCLTKFVKYPQVKAIGFPYSWQMFSKDKWGGINQRLQSCYMVRTEVMHAKEQVSFFEDFATFLAIRVANGITLRYGHAGMDIEQVGENQGGHQDFNRRKGALEEVAELRKIYPALKFKRVQGKSWAIEPDLRDNLLRSL